MYAFLSASMDNRVITATHIHLLRLNTSCHAPQIAFPHNVLNGMSSRYPHPLSTNKDNIKDDARKALEPFCKEQLK